MKKLIALMLALIMILSLAACGSSHVADDGEEVSADDGVQLEESPFTSDDIDSYNNLYIKTQYRSYGEGEGIYFYLFNNLKDEYVYTRDWCLEKYLGDSTWGSVPFTDSHHSDDTEQTIKNLECVGFRIDPSELGIELTAGKYRILLPCDGIRIYTEFMVKTEDPESDRALCALEDVPEDYSADDAIADSVAIITSEHNYNTDKLYEFTVMAAAGIPCSVRLVFTGESGVTSVMDLSYADGKYSRTRMVYTADEATGAVSASVSDPVTRSHMVSDGTNIYLSNSTTAGETADEDVLVLRRTDTTAAADMISFLIPTSFAAAETEE